VFRRGEQRDRRVLLSDLFAGRQAVRDAAGEQDRLDEDADDQQGHGRTPTAKWSSRPRWLYVGSPPASRLGGARGLDKPALRAMCEDTRNAVRARVRLCPTACPTDQDLPMGKPNPAGIIIRVSGVRVPPPASQKAPQMGGFLGCSSDVASLRGTPGGTPRRGYRFAYRIPREQCGGTVSRGSDETERPGGPRGRACPVPPPANHQARRPASWRR
jgi:hypothetical protein